jgi:DnaJ-class molecular chaperone
MRNKHCKLKADLEVPCRSCRGTRGAFDDDGVRESCADCGGAGYVPTEYGQKVLALMRHNFNPMLQDATGE